MAPLNKDEEFRNAALLSNIGLLITHIFLLLLFRSLRVTPMFYFNIGSVLLYIIGFYMVWRKQLLPLIFMFVMEILLHFIAATICTGMECGFELYCFALVCVIYYTSYTYSSVTYMVRVPLITSIATLAAFMALWIHDYYRQPLYPMPDAIAKRLFLMNTALSFAYIMLSLINYTRIAVLSENALRDIADYDELTKIYTRRKIQEILTEMEGDARKSKRNFCITILDVDNFKGINDTFGHDAGDYVLRTIAEMMRNICGKENKYARPARWGGDEFIVVQEFDGKQSTEESCRLLVKKIHDTVMHYRFVHKGKLLSVSMTGGFAAHQKGSTIDETFKRADENLYKGKQNGKNQVV